MGLCESSEEEVPWEPSLALEYNLFAAVSGFAVIDYRALEWYQEAEEAELLEFWAEGASQDYEQEKERQEMEELLRVWKEEAASDFEKELKEDLSRSSSRDDVSLSSKSTGESLQVSHRTMQLAAVLLEIQKDQVAKWKHEGMISEGELEELLHVIEHKVQ